MEDAMAMMWQGGGRGRKRKKERGEKMTNNYQYL